MAAWAGAPRLISGGSAEDAAWKRFLDHQWFGIVDPDSVPNNGVASSSADRCVW